MVDPVVIFSRVFSLRAIRSVAREILCVLPHVVLRRHLLQFALVHCVHFKEKKWETEYCRRGCCSRDGGACGGVSSQGGRRRAVRLCVGKRSRRRAGDRKPCGRRDRSVFAKSSGSGKNTKFSPSFANFAKMQNSNAKPLDTSI